jgi:hypothetical protein
MTRLLSPPNAVTVTLKPGGIPVHIAGEWTGGVDPIARWKVDGGWWNEGVVREYWKVLLNSEVLCELFHDMARDEWFVERVYD